MEDKCKVCGGDFKIIPAGISKSSGRPYEAFTACSTRGCTGTPERKPLTPPSFVRQSQVDKIKGLQENKGRLIEEAQGRKNDSINRFNSLNASISLVCNHPIYQSITDEKELLIAIYELQKEFYNHNSKADNFEPF